LFENLGIVQGEQIRFVPGSGVDCRRFQFKPLPSREPGQARLLFVGRLLGDKGVRELAEAMRKVRQRLPLVELTLVGELGALNRTAITAAEVESWEADGLLRHAGRAQDVRPFLAAADAVVLPSYREGMPRSLLEAAAVGRPLLAADVPGCRELVAHGKNGFLFEARSADSLAEAIQRFAAMPFAERQALGRAARQIAEQRFDERHVTDTYLQSVIALTGKSG
jgi:glycosyltransferase involved in cell wall biosynthesis